MEKQRILDFFGGREQTAAALEISGRAVEKWPDPVSKGTLAKVLVAGVKVKGLRATRRAFPGQLGVGVG